MPINENGYKCDQCGESFCFNTSCTTDAIYHVIRSVKEDDGAEINLSDKEKAMIYYADALERTPEEIEIITAAMLNVGVGEVTCANCQINSNFNE